MEQHEITKEKLNEIIFNGIDVDIFKAERGYALFKAIGENTDRVNSSDYARFFGSAQSAFREQFLMATARLFDKPNPRYPSRHIRGLVMFLKENINQLPPIVEKQNLYITMMANNFSNEEVRYARAAKTDAEITDIIIDHYTSLLDDPKCKEVVEKLKDARDKQYAHSEIGAQITSPTFRELLDLIELAKGLLGVIGWAYLSMVYSLNGKYHLTDEAISPKFGMLAMLDDLDKVPKDY